MTREDVERIEALMDMGENITVASRQLGLHVSNLRYWEAKLGKKFKRASKSRPHLPLRNEVQELARRISEFGDIIEARFDRLERMLGDGKADG